VNGNDGPDDRSPAERRLGEHLELLRRAPLQPDRSLVARIGRTARWQRVVRAPLRVVGMIAEAVVDGLLKLALPPGRRRR
jgi:hypothetical protein